MRAMRYLGIGPQEWDALPFYWQERVLIAMDAESYAEEQAIKKARQH